MSENLEENKIDKNEIDYTIDFVTSSAISRIGIKFLALYIPILWMSGYMAVAVFFDVSRYIPWYINMFLIPVWLFILYFIFIFGIAIFTKAFLLIINMIHRPREGVFRAEEGDQDYEFWRLRVELKKLVLWFMSRGPLPWVVMWGFRWIGVNIDFSSHAQDAWVDGEFIEFGRNITVGQGTAVMSSMVVGNYLIIKKIILGDHIVVGGVSNVSPGTIVGKESVLGGFTTTIPNQIIEQAWIYLGQPVARKLKPNKYAEQRRDVILRRQVDEEVKYEVKQEVNIDEDKKMLLDKNKED
ncbi:MAG: hypothetical protein CEE43_12165 [Promethearchaeota archaeon Loki_b32]|nr:MAG: hypothetical protein CEE43_12165 [Candidatus Lokiarchaeota archaeon Loki_b32]